MEMLNPIVIPAACAVPGEATAVMPVSTAVPDDGHKPPDIDTSIARQARVYDYWLGGCFR